MKRLPAVLFLLIPLYTYAFNISVPEFNAYTEYNASNNMVSSYKFDLLIDTGLKYGLTIGLGFKKENFSTLNSNFIDMTSLKLYANPVENFYFGYFLGKNVTLGYMDFGYRGFQYHQRTDFEYIGYKDLTGNGIEIYGDLWDNLFEPHLYVYQPNMSNTLTLDSVLYLKMDYYTIEGYIGFNNIFNDPDMGYKLTKHFGLYLKTIFGKVDFMLGMYMPDSYITNVPVADDIYLNASEHIVYYNFEQTMTLFTRPSSYNGNPEAITNDFDFYLALGVKFDTWGTGVENTFLMSANYDMTDRAGLYLYLMINNLQYKVGAYYDVSGNAFTSPYGCFVSITGSL